MINRALIDVFSEIAREKNVERSELGSIIEQLFLHLIERDRGDSSNCSVIVNPVSYTHLTLPTKA